MQGRFLFEQAPGHLIRRAHQISVAVFAEETAAFGVTPVQFAILSTLRDAQGIDQITMAERVAFDPATIGSVIGRLEAKGWLRRESATNDRRRKLLWLTPEGERLTDAMRTSVEAVQHRIVEPLNEAERAQLLALLTKLVAQHQRDRAA